MHLYEELGPSFVRELDGMFAIALWDDRRKRLVLARDRFGKKPLLYAEAGGRLWFGSEFQALLADPAIRRDIDYDALDEYLSFMSVPAPLHHLPADSQAAAGARAGSRCAGHAPVKRYWSLEYLPKIDIGEDEAAREVRRLLTEAVRKRLISEVPLGAFLSGGVDSSAVVAIMAGLVSDAGQDVLDRLRRSALQRAAARAAGGRALRLRPSRVRGAAARDRGAADARAALRRAVRGLVGDSELLSRAADAPARDRGA